MGEWKRIYVGHVVNDDVKTFYFVDDADALPPNIRDLTPVHTANWSATVRTAALKREAAGDRVCIQVGDLFYETPEDDEE